MRDAGDLVVGNAGDIPVVVTRGRDGVLRGFVNMCRHRGYRVCEAAARGRKRLVCKYHAWTYGLDGSLIGAPGSHEDPTFDASELGLKPVAVEQWGPAVFVNGRRGSG